MGKTFRRYLAAGLLAGFLCLSASGARAKQQDVLQQQDQSPESQTQVQSEPPIDVEANPQIFSVMCALDAAGFDVDSSALGDMPQRQQFDASLPNLNDPAAIAVREFYRQHELGDPAQVLSRYISLALVVGPPPAFEFHGDQDTLPPDVLDIQGFQPLLANFYQAEHLYVRWREIEPEYESAMAPYRGALAQIVNISNAYLREIVKPGEGTFRVYVEPTVGSRINFRNYGADYAVVVGPKTDASVEAIRYGFLHFMLDPMVLSDQAGILKKEALLQVAARAPQLPAEYQNDFISFFDECLVRAVDMRVRNLPVNQQDAELAKDDASGFILVRPLVAELKVFEKSEPAMSYYFPDLVNGIDVVAEEARLQNYKFANGPAQQAEGLGFSQNTRAVELDQLVAEGDREIAQQNAAAAARTFEQVVAKYPNDPRGLYGLAIASVLSGKAGRAKELFEKIVSLSNNAAEGANVAAPQHPEILAWAYVYLGRINDLEDDREDALAEYRAAQAVDGAPEDARIAAANGVEAPYAPAGSAGNGKGSQQ